MEKDPGGRSWPKALAGFLMMVVGLSATAITLSKLSLAVDAKLVLILLLAIAAFAFGIWLMATNAKSKGTLGASIFVGLLVSAVIWFYGPLAYGLWSHGFLDKPTAAHEYEGTSIDNLKAMRTALLGYEESEGQFPFAAGWMDAIENRLHTDDLKAGESTKKLIAPQFVGQPQKFGYSYNPAMQGKYRAEIKDPKTVLVFESGDTGKNASADPAKARKGLAITLDGSILR